MRSATTSRFSMQWSRIMGDQEVMREVLTVEDDVM